MSEGINWRRWTEVNGRPLQQLLYDEVHGAADARGLDETTWDDPTGTTFTGWDRAGNRWVGGVRASDVPHDDFDEGAGNLDLAVRWTEDASAGVTLDLNSAGYLAIDIANGANRHGFVRSRWLATGSFDVRVKFNCNYVTSEEIYQFLGWGSGATPSMLIGVGGIDVGFGWQHIFFCENGYGPMGTMTFYGFPYSLADTSGELRITRRMVGENAIVSYWFKYSLSLDPSGNWHLVYTEITPILTSTPVYIFVGGYTPDVPGLDIEVYFDDFWFSGASDYDPRASWARGAKLDLCSDDFEGVGLDAWKWEVPSIAPAGSVNYRQSEGLMIYNDIWAPVFAGNFRSEFSLTGDFDVLLYLDGGTWPLLVSGSGDYVGVILRVEDSLGAWVQINRWRTPTNLDQCWIQDSTGAVDEAFNDEDWSAAWLRLKRVGVNDQHVIGAVKPEGGRWDIPSSGKRLAGDLKVQIIYHGTNAGGLGSMYWPVTLTSFVSVPQKRSPVEAFPADALAVHSNGHTAVPYVLASEVSFLDASAVDNPPWMRFYQWYNGAFTAGNSNAIPGNHAANHIIRHVFVDPDEAGRFVVSVKGIGFVDLNFAQDRARLYNNVSRYTYLGDLAEGNDLRGYGAAVGWGAGIIDALKYFRLEHDTGNGAANEFAAVYVGSTAVYVETSMGAVLLCRVSTSPGGAEILDAAMAGPDLYVLISNFATGQYEIHLYANVWEKETEAVWESKCDQVYNDLHTHGMVPPPTATFRAIDAVEASPGVQLLAIASDAGVWVVEVLRGDWAAGEVNTLGTYGSGRMHECLGGMIQLDCSSVKFTPDAKQLLVGQFDLITEMGGISVIIVDGWVRLYWGDDSSVWVGWSNDCNMELRDSLITSSLDGVRWVGARCGT